MATYLPATGVHARRRSARAAPCCPRASLAGRQQSEADSAAALTSERSGLVNKEVVLGLFQLELDAQLQRALTYERFEQAQVGPPPPPRGAGAAGRVVAARPRPSHPPTPLPTRRTSARGGSRWMRRCSSCRRSRAGAAARARPAAATRWSTDPPSWA